MSHILFLLNSRERASYSLRCEVQLCHSSDLNSNCKKSYKSCGVGPFMCDASNYQPEDDDVVVAAHGSLHQDLIQLNSLFFRSATGATFLDKLKQVHGDYDFRKHKTDNCVTCSSDNKNIVPMAKTLTLCYRNYMSVSNRTGSYRNCGDSEVDYRVKFCPENDKTCDISWSTVTVNEFYSNHCENENSTNHGVFMKTEIYEKIEKDCGPWVVVRDEVLKSDAEVIGKSGQNSFVAEDTSFSGFI